MSLHSSTSHDEKTSVVDPVSSEEVGKTRDIEVQELPDQILEAHVDKSKWYNKRLKIGKFNCLPYSSSFVQMIMVSFIFFLCPGMFNALTGLGGGGQMDSTVQSNGNVALYACFATIGFFAGTIANKLGVRATMTIGSFGYALYIASFLCYNITENGGFVIASGAILGFCAACLWCAQGMVVMGYPAEHEKGRYIAVFWVIFNLGGVIGSLVPLIQTSVDNTELGKVGNGTYAAFLALSAVGWLIAMFMLPAKYVVKSDNTRVIVRENPTWKSEVIALGKTIVTDKHIILLFPMFWASNWFYTYQFNQFNQPRFNIRTRSLNNLLYWVTQIIGAGVIGLCLDSKRVGRKNKARIAHITVFVLTMAIWGGGYDFQKQYTRADIPTGPDADKDAFWKIDWSDSRYGGPCVLYMCYGLFDAVWQTYIFWVLGALSNSARKVAVYAGFYKGIQSAGAAVVWRLDATGAEYMSIFASCWALCCGSLVLAAPVIWFYVKDHTEAEEDIQDLGPDVAVMNAAGEKDGEDKEHVSVHERTETV